MLYGQGTAAYLMERYEDAEAACVEGLALEPGSQQLQQALRVVREAVATSAVVSPHQPASTST